MTLIHSYMKQHAHRLDVLKWNATVLFYEYQNSNTHAEDNLLRYVLILAKLDVMDLRFGLRERETERERERERETET